MNYFYLRVFAVSAAVAVAFSCQEKPESTTTEPLATPEVSAVVNDNDRTVTISWAEVPNATTYSWYIDSNSARTTDQTSVTVSTSDLTDGEHTAYVIANPALDAADQYSASQPGSYTFTVTVLPEPQRLETPEVTANQDGNGAIVISWSSSNAASYTYSFDSGEWTNTTDASVTYQVADLTIGSHTMQVVALPEEGSTEYLESLPGECTFYIEEPLVEPNEDLQPWVGTYDGSCTHRIVVNVNDNSEIVFGIENVGASMTGITIRPSSRADYLRISGLSGLEEYSFWATLFESEDGKQCLGIVTGDMAIAQDSQGNDMVCAPICRNEEDGAVAIFSGTEYAYLIDPETMTSIPHELMSSSNVRHTVYSADIFSFDGNSVGVYYNINSFPIYIPAGDFEFTKTSTTYAAQDSKVMTVVKAAPTSMSSTVTK